MTTVATISPIAPAPSPGPAAPAPHRLSFESRDPAQTLAWLDQQYAGRRRLPRAGADFWFRHRAASQPGITATRSLLRSASLHSQDPASPAVGVVSFLSGRARLRTGSDEMRSWQTSTFLVPAGRDYEYEVHDTDFCYLTLDQDLVTRLANELTGVAPARFAWTGLAPVSAEAERGWRAAAAFVGRALHAPTPLSPLVLASATRLLTSYLLSTFPNTALTEQLAQPAAPATPAAVRRAMTYAEAHAAEPITVADLATASGIGVRALQYAFQRHQGRTPMSYLRRIRLERAHTDLQLADPTRGDTVAAIAGRWGFTNTSRFSEAYRRAYGQPPSRTLRA